MEYVGMFMICFWGAFLLRTVYLHICKKENFIYYTLVCMLIDKKGLQVRDISGKGLSKKELYERLDISNSFAEKIWFDLEDKEVNE